MYNYTGNLFVLNQGVICLKKIALIVNFDKENALTVASRLIRLLEGKAKVYCSKEDAQILPANATESDEELFSICPVAAVLGGDGTIIAAAKRCAPYKNILVGINTGNLGYLSTIESTHLEEAAELLCSDSIHYDDRYMLCARVYSNGREIACHHALNEVVISRASNSRLMNFTAYSDGKTLCHYRADGMIIATPTGSTAYSLSAGGPVLSPDADAMLITPICPHMLRARSIVLPPEIITIKADSKTELSIDGQIFESLDTADYITVEKSYYTARLVHNKELSFYDILQTKL